MVIYPLKGEPKNSEAEEEDEDNANTQPRPTALAILAEEELVMIDLTSDNLPAFYPLPYLNSIHPSAVTCFQHVDSVTEQVYNVLKKIGVRGEHSKSPWPITGGKLSPRPEQTNSTSTSSGGKSGGKKPRGKCLLITGHEV